jgi:hypothetical protein
VSIVRIDEINLARSSDERCVERHSPRSQSADGKPRLIIRQRSSAAQHILIAAYRSIMVFEKREPETARSGEHHD